MRRTSNPSPTAFVRGVNAWVTMARRDPPEEFVLAGWAPELWRPEDLLNRTDAFLQSGDADLEAFRARLIAAVGASPCERAPSVELAVRRRGVPSDVDLDGLGEVVGEAIRRVGTSPFFLGLSAPVVPAGPAGSNAWAIPGIPIGDRRRRLSPTIRIGRSPTRRFGISSI